MILVLPDECAFYRGPHSITCQLVLWSRSQCSEEGWKFPENVTKAQNASSNMLNIV